MTHELSILGRAGDIKITWDHNDPEAREKARAEVKKLREAGYLFFLMDDTPADEIAAGNGELKARLASDEEILGPEPEATEPETDDAPKKRGRKAGVPNKVKSIAVPPLRGG